VKLVEQRDKLRKKIKCIEREVDFFTKILKLQPVVKIEPLKGYPPSK